MQAWYSVAIRLFGTIKALNVVLEGAHKFSLIRAITVRENGNKAKLTLIEL